MGTFLSVSFLPAGELKGVGRVFYLLYQFSAFFQPLKADLFPWAKRREKLKKVVDKGVSSC
jgi:hypothetical protein